VEYAYFHACHKRTLFDPKGGVAMPDILAAVEDDGQPEENGWPYLDQLPSDISLYKPPASVGTVYRRDAHHESGVLVILSMLAQGRAPLIAMNVSREFFLAKANQVVRAPISSPSAARHGVVVVGNGEEQKESVLLIRNSWGDRWGDHGHAWISRDYLEPRLISVGVMEL
jgi:C1A family cysteine protease